MKLRYVILSLLICIAIQAEHHNLIADEYYLLAHNLLQEKQREKALDYYKKAIEIEPNHFNAMIALAQEYYEEKKLDDAIIYYEHAARIRPQDTHVLFNCAQIYSQKENWKKALEYYQKTHELDPSHMQAHLQIAAMYEKNNEYEKAIETYHEIIADNDQAFDAYHRLGNAYKHLERLEEAVEPYRKARALKPRDLHILMELANTLNMLDQCQEAMELYKEIVTLNRGVISALYNFGYTLKKMGHLDQALTIYNEVLEKKSDYAPARFSRSTIYLAHGDFLKGFEEYEWRWQAYQEKPQKYNRPLWEGEDLTGKILLVYAEQGLGDTLQFIRYLKCLKEQYRNFTLILETQDPLYDLLKRQSYIDQTIPRSQSVKQCHYHVPLLSLPRILKTEVTTVPCDIPYIEPDARLVSEWHEKLQDDTNFKIGICWQGNAQYSTLSLRKAVASKSVPLSLFAPLAQMPDVSLYSLQQVNGIDQIADCGFADKLIRFDDFDSKHGRFMDTAALMKNLDLVISVDTAPCHLAAAMGIPTWILLPYPSDWRWLCNRTDSVWYSSVRLFKQPRAGDWKSVMQDIATELTQKRAAPRPKKSFEFLSDQLAHTLD